MAEPLGEGAPSGSVEPLHLRTVNGPLMLPCLTFFVMAGFIWLGHEFGSRPSASGPIFVGVFLACGVGGLLYALLPLELWADEHGLQWRQAGPRRSLRWSEIEGFGVWRDRSLDDWNDHPVVRLTRQQRPRPPARLMIRLTPVARQARKTQTLYQRSGYDIGLILPVRMTLTMLESELERRLVSARRAEGTVR